MGNVILALFNDTELKEFMCIPNSEFDNLITFRDEYCLHDINPNEVVDEKHPCRLVLSFLKSDETRNKDVIVRDLCVQVYVHKKKRYNVSDFALSERNEKIIYRIKSLLHNKRVGGFLFYAFDMRDLVSGNPEYTRSYISFRVKNIL